MAVPAAGPAAVHVVGNAGIDTTFSLPCLPRAGETVNAAGTSEGIGGKGINQAVAAARSGARVTLWAAIGTDAGAETIRRALSAEGMGLDGLTALPGATDRSSILVDAAGENAIASDVSAARAYDPTQGRALSAAIREGDLVVLQGNFRSEVTRACLSIAKARGATTIVNASPLTSEGMDLSAVDIVVVNAGEAEMLTGWASPETAACALVGAGQRHAIVTLGADGALLAVRSSHLEASEPAGAVPTPEPAILRIPAIAVVPLDTSGAGDVFCGVLAGCLASGMPIDAAARLAVRAAAIAVTRPGTLASCPTAAEIAALRALS